MTKRILFVLTNHDRIGPKGAAGAKPSGFYLSEVSHPYHVLHEAAYAIDFASPLGGPTTVDGLDLQDPLNAAFWGNPQLREATQHTLAIAELKASDYLAIFYVGGHATMWDFPDCAALAELATKIYEQGGIVAAVCHGVAGLLNIRLNNGAYLVADKTVAAFSNEEEEAMGLTQTVPFLLADALQERGATHHPAANFQPQVVVSERVVTGQNPASAILVAQAMLPLLSAAAASSC